ncbi:MAM and LDL-receptor class A domain-containing protein 1-like [Sycon ciliatum]|uniref:MAM and LDL-receptor class A domain-containing protein 1-like n=1 Tax=Sycon ciliatum TaxID=27933 RepID=UPI0031F6B53D
MRCRINAEPDPEQRKALKIERSAKLHEIRRILQKEGEQYWQRKAVEVDALRPDPRSYFNAINNLRQLRSGKKAAPVRLADADGRIMADISWNLNAFNEYYESVFYTDGQPLDLRQQSNEEDPFTIEEVRSAIIKQKSGGAVGPDGISADALKSAKNLFAPWLTNFFNAVQATEYCPDDMRCGLIVPIYKAGKPLGHPKSLRPVMLLSVVRKILTSILTRRHTLHEQSYVAESQAGFRPGRSTTDGVFYARTMCERALLGDWSYSSALLDFSGAFDTVIRQVALERLATAGAPTSTTAVLVSNTTARTKLGKQLSKPFPTNIGVVQGDPMSPIMFITYAEGSMRKIREQALPASDLPATFTQYADDTTAHQHERSSVEETVPCKASHADFTTGLSGYTQATSIDQFDWTRNTGTTTSTETGPLSDRSTWSGHYLYIEASSRTADDKAIIYSPHYTTLHPKVCTFSFWYHMYGEDIGMLNVYVKTSTANVRVFTQSGNKGNNWLRARVLLNTVPAVTSGQFQLSFEGIRGGGYRGDIAIDDIGLEDDCCSGNTSTSSLKCRVPVIQNGMSNASLVQYGATVQFTCDHTYFLWGNPSATCNGNDTLSSVPICYRLTGIRICRPPNIITRITERLFNYTSAQALCSSHNGTILSDASFHDGCSIGLTNHNRKAWRGLPLKNNKAWTTNGIQIVDLSFRLRVVCEIPCLPRQNDQMESKTMADDISCRYDALNCSVPEIPNGMSNASLVQYGATVQFTCDHTSFLWGNPSATCNSNGTLSSVPICYTCKASTADFTTGLSGYTQATRIEQFYWTRKQGATPDLNTGPLSDHSSGSGHYLYIETSPPSQAGDKAIIYSPHYTILHTKVCTFSFWYHMYGRNIGTLNVYVKTSTANVKVFTQSGNMGDEWLHARVLLNTVPAVTSGPFQLSFEGIRGRGFYGDIAIDDIGLEDDCYSGNTSASCAALGSLLIALTDVHNQTSYDLVITMIAANNTPEVVTLYNQMLSSTYHPSAIPAGLATTQVIVAVFAVGTTTPLNVYIKDESEVTQNNLLAMMKDSRNYMMQGMVASSAASPTRPLTAQTTWKVAGTPTPTAHYRIFNADCYGSSPPDTCTRPTYTAISMNASSLTFLTYGVYEVVFQVTTGSGPTAKTKYITPPLRLTVNTDIILGQTPVCPLPTTDSPMVNVPCTCEDGFSWNSTRSSGQ